MSNIKDIARLAGVSVTTVSRVLNDEPYVSEEKRRAVLVAIEKTNYQRNLNAVNLSKGKTNMIGVVVPLLYQPHFGMVIDGIANEAIENNYKLVLIQSNYDELREIEALEMLKHKQVDSLIIYSRICSLEKIEEYLKYGPIVLSENSKRTDFSSTFIDHYKSFMIALQYLFNKGHRNIGYCIGRRTSNNSKFRELAYNDFLRQNDIPIVDNNIFENCLNFEDGERVVQSLIRMKNRPTALLVTSDQVAAGIQTCCNDHGIAIPKDLAIIGFDNQPIAKVMKLTTVEIPLSEVGRKLFNQAIKNEVFHEEIAVKLIERQTV
jgi:DNA-binding LacI/PurR family transcriptional regulator